MGRYKYYSYKASPTIKEKNTNNTRNRVQSEVHSYSNITNNNKEEEEDDDSGRY